LAQKRGAGEGAADEPDIALRKPEGVADVAGAVAIDVAHLGVLEHVKVGEANLQDATAKLEAAGISVEPHRKNGLRVIVTPAEMKQHESVIREVLGNASVTVGGGLS